MNVDDAVNTSGPVGETRGQWQAIRQALELEPHPEGGYYREVFRSSGLVAVGDRVRSAGTSIHYLLAEGAYSAWHRIDAEEIWYFHSGTGLKLHVLLPGGELVGHVLADPAQMPGAVFQATVPAGCWFAAELLRADGYALVSCAVMPGFEFSGFELAKPADMEPAAQAHGYWLTRLLSTRS